MLLSLLGMRMVARAMLVEEDLWHAWARTQGTYRERITRSARTQSWPCRTTTSPVWGLVFKTEDTGDEQRTRGLPQQAAGHYNTRTTVAHAQTRKGPRKRARAIIERESKRRARARKVYGLGLGFR